MASADVLVLTAGAGEVRLSCGEEGGVADASPLALGTIALVVEATFRMIGAASFKMRGGRHTLSLQA